MKITISRSVRISEDIYKLVIDHAHNKGMNITKVIEFACLDYITKSKKS